MSVRFLAAAALAGALALPALAAADCYDGHKSQTVVKQETQPRLVVEAPRPAEASQVSTDTKADTATTGATTAAKAAETSVR
jgi:hypothetical protein